MSEQDLVEEADVAISAPAPAGNPNGDQLSGPATGVDAGSEREEPEEVDLFADAMNAYEGLYVALIALKDTPESTACKSRLRELHRSLINHKE